MLDKKTIVDYIERLIPVSRQAGDAILEIYHSEEMGVESKNDESPLTKADLASNKIICEALKSLNANIPIISEENENLSYLERAGWDLCWIVDPLDGTKEFIKKNGEFTTNIALIKGNNVIAGVVYIPVLEEMYYALQGEGAYMVKNGETSQLLASEFKIDQKGIRVVCSRSHLNEKTQSLVDNLNDPQLIAKGSSLKFLSIAKGEADLYPRMAPTMEWDTAAAQIILEESGGSVCIEESDIPVEYNKENLLNPHFIARGRAK